MDLRLTHREKEIQKILEIYREQIIQTFIVCNIYCDLNEKRDEYLKEFNLAPAFFGTVFRSLRTSCILSLTKLFDDREKDSLGKLLNIVENNIRIFSKSAKANRIGAPETAFFIVGGPEISAELVQTQREEIHSFAPTLGKLKVLRDKYHAHFDNVGSEIIAQNQFGIDEIEKMKDYAGKLWNVYNAAFEAGSYHFSPMNNYDVVEVLNILKAHNTARELDLKQQEDEFRRKYGSEPYPSSSEGNT
jgi:hypothetical protein